MYTALLLILPRTLFTRSLLVAIEARRCKRRANGKIFKHQEVLRLVEKLVNWLLFYAIAGREWMDLLETSEMKIYQRTSVINVILSRTC